MIKTVKGFVKATTVKSLLEIISGSFAKIIAKMLQKAFGSGYQRCSTQLLQEKIANLKLLNLKNVEKVEQLPA